MPVHNVVDAAQDAEPGLDNASSQTDYRWIYTGYPSDAGTSTISFYADSDAMNAALNRPAGVYDGNTNGYVDYYYLGLNEITWTSYYSTSGNGNHTLGTVADHYPNLDRYAV